MAEYSAAFKARVVQQLVGSQAVSATRLAAAVGVTQPTLSRWVREVRSMELATARAFLTLLSSRKLSGGVG